ncbi:MAG: hypothetical protein IKU36_00575 [Bacteroidales bacterium]|nr:hypothetical protein [Bacteroidales bacterium]
MSESGFPETGFRLTLKVTDGGIIEKMLPLMSEHYGLYENVLVDGDELTVETTAFTNLLFMISFYKSAVSLMDDIDFESVDQHRYLESMSLSVEYRSRYWAERLMHELKHVVTLCGPSATIASPVVDGNTVTVVLKSWNALFSFDEVLMKAGYGYSTYQEPQSSEAIREKEPENDGKSLWIVGICAVVVILLIISLI